MSTEMEVDKVQQVKVAKVSRKPRNFPLSATFKRRSARSKPFSEHRRSLRSSIVPGTVLILLTGAYRGSRVVFLKQLKSGLLLVNGPFKVNGVPMRRVHQKLVIATSTKLDVSAVAIPEHIDDAYFQKEKTSGAKKSDDIFASKKSEYVVKEQRKVDQKAVDAALIGAIKGREDKGQFVKYVKTIFGLSNGDKPHTMKF